MAGASCEMYNGEMVGPRRGVARSCISGLVLSVLSAALLATAPAVGHAQDAGTAGAQPDPLLELAHLEARRQAAEERSLGFGFLTIGGSSLLVAGVAAIVAPWLIIEASDCEEDCAPLPLDLAPGFSISVTGIIAILVGGILWGEAERSAAALMRQLDYLRSALSAPAHPL